MTKKDSLPELKNSFSAKMLTHLSSMGRKFSLHVQPGDIHLILYLKDNTTHIERGQDITTVFVKTLDYVSRSPKF